jgi:hypothetical protein
LVRVKVRVRVRNRVKIRVKVRVRVLCPKGGSFYCWSIGVSLSLSLVKRKILVN